MADKYADPFVELRGEILREHMDVIDAVAQATPGATRVSIMREVIARWVDQKVNEATLIERVRRGNGYGLEGSRNLSGSPSAGKGPK